VSVGNLVTHHAFLAANLANSCHRDLTCAFRRAARIVAYSSDGGHQVRGWQMSRRARVQKAFFYIMRRGDSLCFDGGRLTRGYCSHYISSKYGHDAEGKLRRSSEEKR
jgi:hypothetical protein